MFRESDYWGTCANDTCIAFSCLPNTNDVVAFVISSSLAEPSFISQVVLLDPLPVFGVKVSQL